MSPKENNEHLAKIQRILKRISHLPGFPDTDEKFTNFSEDYAEFADTNQVTRSDGPVVPAEWLIREIRRTQRFCPAPATARQIYCSKFTPLDGFVIYPDAEND